MSGTNPWPKTGLDPADGGIAQAAALLRAGELVAIPTETVYGLAARADSADAVAAIYRTKGRPDFNPLIVHVAGIEQARRLAYFDERAEALAARYWPGPLTLVLPARADNGIAPAVTAGLATIALRSPAHPVAAALLAELGLPLAAPSANRSLGVSPTSPEHVLTSLGEACPPVLDGGPCAAGVESTIIALREGGGWSLLRPGPVSGEELTALLGVPDKSRGATIEAPGQMARHYSPGKPVRLGAAEAETGEFHIGFGGVPGDISLSPTGDLAEAASRFYACLHLAAAASQQRIAVAPIPQQGMGAAINDRLQRAAS
jgi:L-threonylcarbamoyladenylate synthase